MAHIKHVQVRNSRGVRNILRLQRDPEIDRAAHGQSFRQQAAWSPNAFETGAARRPF
jgi:hypothetical protein